MWFFLVKSMLGAVIGQSTNAWFKKTAMGKWFYAKVESWYNWAAERYDLKILTAEEKTMQKFPILSKRLDAIEKKLGIKK
tara:strand:+ start:506 stop:745 length:240 start_codon:yes stop_codon:yes gene_type:complete